MHHYENVFAYVSCAKFIQTLKIIQKLNESLKHDLYHN